MFDDLIRAVADRPGDSAPLPWQIESRPGPVSRARCDLAEAGWGSGTLDMQFGDGAIVTVVDGSFGRALHNTAVTQADLLLVRAGLSNHCDYRADGAMPWLFQRPAVTVSALPRGTRMEIHVEPGTVQRTATVLMEPQTLLRHHGVDASELPDPLRRLVEGRLEAPETLLSMPVQADIAALVHDLTHSRLVGAMRRMQVQARGAELLALVIAAWRDRLQQERWPGARGRDAELVAAARRILTERCTDPPTLQALSSELGTNKNKLNQLFTQLLGITPQAFCLQRRIERAQALIIDGRLNVGQVADAVGYQHQSSFTVAFRDVVGVTPREFGRLHRQVPEGAALH